MPDITVNGVDLSTLGFQVSRLPSYLATPALEYDRIQLAGIPGARLVNERVVSRPFSATGYIEGADPAAARANLHRLKWVLRSRQPNEILFGDQALRVFARCLRVSAEPPDPQFVQAEIDVQIDWEAADPPYWLEATSLDVQNIGTTPVELPMGTVRPWNVRAIIEGPATGPIRLIFADKDANDVHEVQVDVDLAATPEYLVLELGPGRITAYVNTTGNPREGTDVLEHWVSSAGDIFVPFPVEWWDYEAQDWMTVRCLAGTARLIYDPAYE